MERAKDTNAIRRGSDAKPAKVNLFQSPRFFADVHVLRPGQSQPPHRHEREDKLYHVLSGHGVVTTGGRELPVGPGWAVWCPPGEEHGVRNDGAEDLRLLVVMAPHPQPPPA
jgi:mannose-6-phosphate isomerase-like protein (cupin superfamily)